MDWSALLAIKDVQVVGIILAGMGAFITALSTGRLYLKGSVDTLKATCAETEKQLREALAAATAENAQCAKDYIDARISIARFEERELFRTRAGRQGD